MQTVQLDILTSEEQAEKHRQIMAKNELLGRERTAATNRANGHAKPEPGDRLYVTTMRGIPRRGRAGVRFMSEARTELIVVDNDPERRGEVPTGVIPVTVDGAEEILADDSLNVSTRPATEAEAAGLRSQLEGLGAELEAAKKEIERLKREARQAAPPDPAGGPARLRAQRNVKAPGDDGFGGRD